MIVKFIYLLKFRYTGLISAGFACWTFIIILIKYGFKNAHRQFRLALRFGSRKDIERAIDRHNSVVRVCEEQNRMFKVFLFVLYYIGSPAIILCINLALSNRIDLFIKYTLSVALAIVLSVVFCLNLFNSLITKTAEKPRLHLYRYLNRKLTFRHRMRIMRFIERLCGSEIGFYCLDLFHMNNYEFYLYITNCAKNYILFQHLFKIQ